MKKSFALVLALIMVFGCLFSVAPMAEATDSTGSAVPAEKYVPDIAYSNVNYTEGLTLMFAVPAPASLDEGSTVKLIVWEYASNLYSYNEAVSTSATATTAIAIEAESQKATIGGKEYLVFKYDGLTADMMTDIIYARAAVVNAAGKATAYGDVIDYSIVEYAQTAMGNFEGTPALANADVVALLDSMLDFGALSQIFIGGGEPYAPNGYLANEELRKIWITPVVAGQTYDKVFGGFFKYEEDGYATVNAPHFDGVSLTAYKNAAGEIITDAFDTSSDAAFGFQVPAVDADINITIEYEVVAIRSFSAEELGAGFYVDNSSLDSLTGDSEKLAAAGTSWGTKSGAPVITSFNYNKTFSSNFSGLAYDYINDSAYRANYYHGAKVVSDPANPDNLVLQFSATGAPTVQFKDTTAKEYQGFGYGDTVEDAITIEFSIGRPAPDSEVSTGYFYFRNREATIPSGKFPLDNQGNQMSKNMHDTYLFAVTKNEVVFVLNTGVGNNRAVGETICTLPEVGLVKIAFTVFSSGEIHGYVADENGNMQLVATAQMAMSERFAIFNAKHKENLADSDPSNDNDFAAFADFSSWFTMNTLNVYWNMGAGQNGSYNKTTGVFTDAPFISESIEIDGVETPLLNVDGTYNKAAVQAYAEKHFSVLIDDLKIFGGALYN